MEAPLEQAHGNLVCRDTPVENHCFIISSHLHKLRRNKQRLLQCFSTFFDSRHPSFAYEQFGSTPSCNLLVHRRKVHNLSAPQELFAAPKGPAAPWLRTIYCKKRRRREREGREGKGENLFFFFLCLFFQGSRPTYFSPPIFFCLPFISRSPPFANLDPHQLSFSI